MDNIYLYPKVFPCENPYIKDLENSLSTHYRIINEKTTRSGVLDLFRFIFRTDVFYFNWIESLTSKRYGKLQVVAFVFFMFLAKSLKKKIVWTLHNQYSHDKTSNKWVDFMFDFMFKHSDFIPTHSQAGVDFVKEKFPAYADKVKYFIHPVKPVLQLPEINEYKFDFFIWGTIWPYKGVTEFLQFLKDSEDGQFYKVLIAGRCIDEQMKAQLDPLLSENVIHLHEFYEIEEIAGFAAESKFTLFTYKPESVLSSGSLMDSIRMGSVIIGPNVGAFNDLKTYGFVKTYDDFSEILEIYRGYKYDKKSIAVEIEAFCLQNSWEAFGVKLTDTLLSALDK